MPQLNPQTIQVLSELELGDVCDAGEEVDVDSLEEGMVLLDDVLTSDGLMLIRSGRRLTWMIIEKLGSYSSSPTGLRPVRVRSVAVESTAPVLV